ncbi:MAG: phosphotransferase [Candidatus Brocadiaceae bacterium]|nr:phosphotransferase [Candidatus Brocadiaceae bacterium]
MVRISSVLKGPRRMRRVAQIASTAASHGLGFLVGRMDLLRYLPARLRLPVQVQDEPPEDLPARLATVLEKLGPTFVKFGQALATRPDILPPHYIRELERICHHVAPFAGDAARSIVAGELGRPVEEVFRDFDEQPRASGSIAQVHDAVLPDGTPVVVKVRRPRIERVIQDDVAILTFLAAQADRVEEFRPFRLPMLVDEFAQGIGRELDFMAEAAYTHRLREQFRNDDRIEIPAVYWDFTTARVLTMRRMEGVHVSEILTEPQRPGIDREAVARTLMDAYLKQVFILGVFHADPHPGNILVTEQGRVALLDFGMVGHVRSRLRRGLGVCVMALGGGQPELVAEVAAEISRVSEERAEEFRQELVVLLERYSSVPVDRLDLQHTFQDVMDVIRRYHAEIPRDLVLMGRALVAVSGTVMRLSPGLRIGTLAAPYGRSLLMQKLSLVGMRRMLMAGGYQLGSLVSDVPRALRHGLQKLQRGDIEFRVRHEGFEKGLRELDQTGNRLSLSIILAAIIIASSSLLGAEIGAVSVLGWRVSLLGLVGLLFGLVLGVWLIVSILRSGRL